MDPTAQRRRHLTFRCSFVTTRKARGEVAPIPIIAPTVVRFSMKMTGPAGHECDNIIDVSLDEFASTRHDAVNAIVPLVVGRWQTDIVGFINNGYTFIGSRWIDLDSLGGTSGFQGPVAGKPVNGGAGGNIMPPNVALLVHKQSIHSREQRDGRLYFPGLNETDVGNDGTLGSTAMTFWQGKFETLRTDLSSGTLYPPATTAWRTVHVVGHAPPPDGRPNAWSSSDITSVSIDSRCATQRRRLRG